LPPPGPPRAPEKSPRLFVAGALKRSV